MAGLADRRLALTVRCRQPAFGRHGRKVVVGFCAYEILALIDPCPLPTLSELVKRRRWVGVVLLGLLGHHWYAELDPAPVSLEPVVPVGSG